MRKLSIEEAVEELRRGGVIVFPTDTVWGVGAAISSKEGIEKLYKVMEREGKKATAVLVGSREMAERYGKLNRRAEELVEVYWPGGLTIVVERTELVPEEITGEKGKVGLRVPDHEIVELIERLGEGLVASSANVGGGMSPKRFEEIEEEFLEKVDGYVAGEAGGKEASSVVEVVGERLTVLRQGEIQVQ